MSIIKLSIVDIGNMNKREKIREKSLQGYSQAETARILGCSRSYINLIKREEGLSFADGNKSRGDLARDKAILWDYLQGESFVRLGERYEISCVQAFRVASRLLPCRPAQAKKLLRGNIKTMSDSEVKTFFESLDSLYGKAYRDLLEHSNLDMA